MTQRFAHCILPRVAKTVFFIREPSRKGDVTVLQRSSPLPQLTPRGPSWTNKWCREAGAIATGNLCCRSSHGESLPHQNGASDGAQSVRLFRILGVLRRKHHVENTRMTSVWEEITYFMSCQSFLQRLSPHRTAALQLTKVSTINTMKHKSHKNPQPEIANKS